MKITLVSTSVVRKPTKPVKKAVRAPKRGADKPKVNTLPVKMARAKRPESKKVKIPNSVQYLAEKGKLRIKFAEPGRYILQGAKQSVVVLRVKEEMKYTPSVANKAFTATASDTEMLQHIGIGEYAEPIELLQSESISYEAEFLRAKGLTDLADKLEAKQELESEAAAKTPGAKNKAAGAKMGKKKRAPNMLAPGWWVFIKPTDGKMRKEYVGPRMSARRLLGVVQGENTSKSKKKSLDKLSTKEKLKEFKSAHTQLAKANKAKIKELANKFNKLLDKQSKK